MTVVFILYFGIYFGIFGLMLLLLHRSNWQYIVPSFSGEKVKVSILIAARNEAGNIERCLNAITRLKYPAELIEVLVGNDGSTDETAKIVEAFIADKPNFKLVSITENLGQARGKGNVLAQLAHLATSEFFFITDADIKLAPSWIEAMLSQLKPGAGIVTGITTVEGDSFLARMQGLDWLLSLGFIQIVSDLNLPVSTMGNNMLITREAYESTGGYENLPFSITEDIQLFNEVLRNGYGFKNVYQAEVLAETKPMETLKALLHQRKRWLLGTGHLPLLMKVILGVYATFYLFLLPFVFYAPLQYAIALLGLKLLCQSLFIFGCFHKLGRKTTIGDLLLFELYQIITSVAYLVFYFLPVKVDWKGRKY